eukprot:g4842.t1
MSYNSANMYAGYNKGGNSGALVGNWVEEAALEADTGSSRAIDLTDPEQSKRTGQRVIDHTERELARDYRSTSHRGVPQSTSISSQGPRAAQRAVQIDEDTAVIASTLQPEVDERTFTTTTSATHAAPSTEAYARPGATDGPTRGEVERELDAQLDARGGAPVTVHTATIDGLGDGQYVGSAVGGRNPLARSTAFTNDIRDARVRHVGACDDSSMQPTPMPPTAGQWAAISRLQGAAQDFEDAGDGAMGLDEFCDRLNALGVSDKDMQHLVAYFDASGTGAVDAGAVRRAFA